MGVRMGVDTCHTHLYAHCGLGDLPSTAKSIRKLALITKLAACTRSWLVPHLRSHANALILQLREVGSKAGRSRELWTSGMQHIQHRWQQSGKELPLTTPR